jgi:hypothetical protein
MMDGISTNAKSAIRMIWETACRTPAFCSGFNMPDFTFVPEAIGSMGAAATFMSEVDRFIF